MTSVVLEGRAPRVLIVSNLFPPQVIGGAEIVAHRQARGLLERGNEVVVLAGGLPDGSAAAGSLSVETLDGLIVYRMVHRSFEPGLNLYWPAAERRLASILATWRPNIVHFHNVTGLGASLIPIARRAGAHVVVTLHDHWGFCFKNTLLRNDGRVCDDPEQCAVCLPRIALPDGSEVPIRLRRDTVAWYLDQADRLLAPSRYMAEAYGRSDVVLRPVLSLSNGIDLARIPIADREADDIVRFVCFSYLGPHKGIPILLEAAEQLAADKALTGRWTLTIAGHGELADGLQRDVAAGRFCGAVRFAGRLPHAEALALLAGSDAVVLASIWPENEPVTMLEAIAAGKAQVATRIGGHPDLVEEGRSGLLVAPGSAEAMAEALARLVRDPGLARQFGAFNAARRERFDECAVLDRLVELYQSIPGSVPGEISTPDMAHAPDEADAFLVLCAGSERPEHLDVLLHRFHLVEDRRPRLRFVWHAWACASAWRAARLLWLWSDDPAEGADLAVRALRAGIPLLVPVGSALSDLADARGLLATYATLAEAAGIIAALGGGPGDGPDLGAEVEGRARGSAPAYARLLNAVQPASAFHLPAVG